MKLLFLSILWCSFLVVQPKPLSRSEIDLLNSVRNITKDSQTIELIDTLLGDSREVSRLPKLSTVIKVTLGISAAAIVVIALIEVLSIALGNELLLSNTKKLYARACKLRHETKEISYEVKQLSEDTNLLNDTVHKGVNTTERLLEEIAEKSQLLDNDERLARSDVLLSRRITILESRLKALNGDAFLSLSEALNLSPKATSPVVDSPSVWSPRSRRHSVASHLVYGLKRKKDEC